ncbi:hypothetical protein ACMD2_06882 [Ananas comosus]|uniref:Uncharacterized protein n=1 Tax=Ananas comosus TaxID=4615 RepID=A0A199W671_ANACO|nr:hypothetical protein ACMD2_06882 [Ananas comosus]
MSQRPNRHQRRASQSVFVLPDNFATTESPPLEEVGAQEKTAPTSTQPPQEIPHPLHPLTTLPEQEIKVEGSGKKIQGNRGGSITLIQKAEYHQLVSRRIGPSKIATFPAPQFIEQILRIVHSPFLTKPLDDPIPNPSGRKKPAVDYLIKKL